MSSRGDTPNLASDLPSLDALGGKQGKPEKTQKQKSAKTEKRKNEAVVKNEDKTRLNIIVERDVSTRLDFAIVNLKQITGKSGHDVSKSRIVELALEIVLDEFDKLKSGSELVRRV